MAHGGDYREGDRVLVQRPADGRAANPATAPQAGVPCDRGGSPGRAAGEQPADFVRHPGLELHVLIGPPFPVSLAAAHPGFFVGEALLLGLLQCCFLGEDALPLVAFPGPAPAHDDSRQAARLPGAAGQRGVTCRDEDQMVHVGAGQAERARVVHDEEIAGAAAASAGPVPDRQDDDQVGLLARTRRAAFFRTGIPRYRALALRRGIPAHARQRSDPRRAGTKKSLQRRLRAAGRGDRVVDEAAAVLGRRHQTHHHASSPQERRRHLRDLFERVVQSVHDGDAEPIIASSRQIAADRLAAGFDIAEIQATFNVLEEVLWRHLASTLAGDQQIEALGFVNTILGAGRDALARTYVDLARRGTSPLDEQPAAPRGGGEAGGAARAAGLAGGAVRTEVLGRVGVITLADQRRRNVLSAQMANGVVAALGSLRAERVRAVVLRAAAGMHVWSAGQAIDELPRGRRDPPGYNDPIEQLLRAIRTCPAPVIAMVHG